MPLYYPGAATVRYCTADALLPLHPGSFKLRTLNEDKLDQGLCSGHTGMQTRKGHLQLQVYSEHTIIKFIQVAHTHGS